MSDPRKFLLTTDYPMPFLVYNASVSRALSAITYDDYFSIEHGLPFTPLLVGQWSTSPTFSPSYDLALEYPNFTGGQPPRAIIVGADNTNIHFSITNNTGTSQTFYFHLAAFAPPSYNGRATAVDDASPFKFNSDYNYPKIFIADSVSVPANSSIVVNHNLGYVPQARIWNQYSTYMGGVTRSIVTPMTTNLNENGLLGARLTAQTLELGTYLTFGSSARTFFYHIYADEV